MPVRHYCLFKGWVVERQLATQKNPHYQIHAIDTLTDYRISVNVFSNIVKARNRLLSQVEFTLVEDFRHPVTTRLEKLEPGLYPLDKPKDRCPDGLALDYIRGNLFNPDFMKPVPFNLPGPNNDLNDYLDKYIRLAITDKETLVCAFGSHWGPENWRDKIFGFKPGNGVHNIHMNQGNAPGMFGGDNGIWQDGGLLFYLGKENRWAGFFIKFQQQTWDTWDDSGKPKYNLARHYIISKKVTKHRRRRAARNSPPPLFSITGFIKNSSLSWPGGLME